LDSSGQLFLFLFNLSPSSFYYSSVPIFHKRTLPFARVSCLKAQHDGKIFPECGNRAKEEIEVRFAAVECGNGADEETTVDAEIASQPEPLAALKLFARQHSAFP
jgi:hypothetical protein